MRVFADAAGLLLRWGPPGVFLLAALDSGGIPIPIGVDALVIAVAVGDADAGLLAAGLAVLGSVLGCLLLYQLGRRGGAAYVDHKAHGTSRAARFRRWFQRYGLLTVFIPALVPAPLPTKVFMLLAGAMNVSRAGFLLVVLTARAARYFGLAWLAAAIERDPQSFFRAHTADLLLGALALFVLLALLVQLVERRRTRATMASASDVQTHSS